MTGIGEQLVALFILAIPLAAVAWTFAHEELLGEVREWFATRSQRSSRLYARKLVVGQFGSE